MNNKKNLNNNARYIDSDASDDESNRDDDKTTYTITYNQLRYSLRSIYYHHYHICNIYKSS